MELEKQANIVNEIRAELTSRLNTRLKVRANMGRSKIIECEGVLMQAHPSLFILEVDGTERAPLNEEHDEDHDEDDDF